MSPKAGGRGRPTIYDVARLAGVSTATVSRALNGSGQIAQSTRLSIEAAVARLGYTPNPIARSLVTRSTQTIALLLPDIGNPFYAALVRGIQEHALLHDHTMLLCTTEGDPEQEERYLSLLHGKQVDGALVDGLVLPPERVAQFVRDGLPIVCLDRDVGAGAVPLVQVDNRLGARLATEHLLALDHRRIAHISGAELAIAAEREAGWLEAHTSRSVRPSPRLLARGGFSEAGGFAAAQQLLAAGGEPTAIFAANDLSALGAISAIVQSGLRVPEDISVVGFDDLALAAYATPPLTTIRQPAAEIGRRATQILLELVAGREAPAVRTLLQPELVVRSSTAVAPRP